MKGSKRTWLGLLIQALTTSPPGRPSGRAMGRSASGGISSIGSPEAASIRPLKLNIAIRAVAS